MSEILNKRLDFVDPVISIFITVAKVQKFQNQFSSIYIAITALKIGVVKTHFQPWHLNYTSYHPFQISGSVTGNPAFILVSRLRYKQNLSAYFFISVLDT
jgi:hypothetical protein